MAVQIKSTHSFLVVDIELVTLGNTFSYSESGISMLNKMNFIPIKGTDRG